MEMTTRSFPDPGTGALPAIDVGQGASSSLGPTLHGRHGRVPCAPYRPGESTLSSSVSHRPGSSSSRTASGPPAPARRPVSSQPHPTAPVRPGPDRLGGPPATSALSPEEPRSTSSYTVAREDDFDFRSTEYALLHAAAGATAFQHGRWLGWVYGALAPRRRASKVVVTVRDARGRLALVLPLVRRRRAGLRALEFADLGVSDYAVPVLHPRDAPALLDGGVAGAIREALGAFDLLRIERVPDSPVAFLSLLAGARASPHAYRTHLVTLAGSVEAWQAQLDPHFVRHLERKRRRLRPKGECRLRVVTDPEEIEPLMGRMRQFRAARFAERRGVDLLQDPDWFAFYCTAARESLGDGPGRLVVLEVAGEAVAVAFDLVDGTTELFVLVGYDFDRLRNYSLGLLIVDELARAAIGRGLRHLDLTVGDEPYKADFGARPRPLFEIRISRTPLGAAAALLRDGHLAARRIAKRAVVGREHRLRSREQSRSAVQGRGP